MTDEKTGSNGILVSSSCSLETRSVLPVDAAPNSPFAQAAVQLPGALRHYENETLGERCDDNQQDYENSDG